MARGYGMAQESIPMTGIWEFHLTPHCPPLRLCPCRPPPPALPRAASASGGAEVISQRSHGNRSRAWLGHGKGQARRRIRDSYFPKDKAKRAPWPRKRRPSEGRDLPKVHLAVSCGAFSPAYTVERKIKKDDHYRGPAISNCTSGNLS